MANDYFSSDPDWEAFASKHGYPLPTGAEPAPLETIEPMELDVEAARAHQATDHTQWTEKHPLDSIGYVARLATVTTRDGTELSVKISYPDTARLRTRGPKPLPVLFVTHGGGWIQGSHTSEEAWLLWPLYNHFDLAIVSVNYRLAPEHQYPTWIDDSWDVLQKLLSGNEPIFTTLDIKLHTHNIILAGSSAGAEISASLSQTCRDKGIPISGVILNVPVLCDYRHFPTQDAFTSYAQAADTFLSSRAMMWVWNTVHPSPASSAEPKASPLLGDLTNLPRHLIFVAGQDALRDEGIAYARNLESSGVQVDLEIYKGVPHNFAEFWELQATKRFWEDITRLLRQWLRVA
ncbi:alpha/beta-hydrolase [Trematosphaeria pertusa]|uniref:Alpha/beta-hydrolase n=1 Tax=Trematosphaeria pertusa TaxID=390896 RepID=A0A6A6I9Q4_9PLEO|nr:alpha/beta-hydrolase [Trematosphaeria pertusa]KAF2246798.1 alpha/beta-hydrolase [Trematosphaeria pertusa]